MLNDPRLHYPSYIMKSLTVTLCAIAAFLFSASDSFAQDSTEIIFEDPMFEVAVREQLQWSGLANDQPITKSHLENITFLWFDEDGEDRVRNLNDLRHFTNLRSLEIWNASGISSFEPLWKVDSINNLYVYGARNPDFSGISAVSALQILDLSDCSLKNLGFLVSANFTELYSLILEANYLDLTEDSNSSLQIETLKNLVEGNRKTKIEAGLYVEENGRGKLQTGEWSFIMMEPWRTDPAVDYDMQIPKAVQDLASEISRAEKILLENPNDPLANLLQGIHTFFNIAESNQKHGLKEFLISLGVEPSIRSFTLADASIAGNFAFELNRDFNSSLLASHLEEGIIPSLVETESHFARIPVNSVINLEPEFTGTEETITVDYADILVLRSMVKILSALASMQSAYDWNLNAGFVKDQDGEDTNTTMQTFRAHNSNLLGIRDKEQLAKARRFLEDGIALYQIASPILTHESRLGYDDHPYPDRLFVIESDSLEDEREFREDLDDLLEALYEPYNLDSDDEGNSSTVPPQPGYHFEDRDLDEHIGIIDLNQFFEGKVDLAQLLPDSSGDRFETYQFRDPTFGGLFPRLSPKRLSTILFEENLVAGQEPHPHDTLTEALTHFDPDAYLSLNQDLKAEFESNASGALDHFKTTGHQQRRRYFFWPFESVEFPICLTEPTVVNGQVVLLNGSLLSAGGSSSVKVGFVISSEGLLPRYDLGWAVHQSALNVQSGFSLSYQPMKYNTTYYYRAYAENEAGRWFGSVKRFKSVGAQADQDSLFEQALSLGNGWYESPWFGILNLPANGWSYHFDLGWIYLPESQQEGVWVWSDQRKGWIWTKSDVWPHLWEHNQASWLYFKKIENQPHFFNFASESYE
jgi:hypothetical protein